MQKQRKSSQETVVQGWGRVLVPPGGYTWQYASEFFYWNQGLHPWGPQTGWKQKAEHQPVTSPPANQRKVTYAAAHPQILPLKTLPPRSSGTLGFFNMSCLFSLLGLPINFSLLQTLMFWFVWPHCASDTQTWVRQQGLNARGRIGPFDLRGPRKGSFSNVMLMLTLGRQEGLCHMDQKRKGVLDGWHKSKLIEMECLSRLSPVPRASTFPLLPKYGTSRSTPTGWW